ncbi:MAG: SDR family NAD(P)-dependent oxidoreductase [Promethearchaeota archaeon]
MKELKNKNCFITGAASGIGRSFAIALAKEGMNLFISDIDMENLEDVKKQIERQGGNVYIDRCDVSQLDDFKKIAGKFFSTLENLDLLINNAGMAIVGNIIDLEIEDWKRVFDVNLWSVIYSIKVFLPHMLQRGSGHIVNVASGTGVIATADPAPYITSKFAVVGLSEALFGHLSAQGINVSVIIPMYVRTNIFNNAIPRYPKKLIEDIGAEKLEEFRKLRVAEYFSKASSPDRVVKKYINGIKMNNLYISETNTLFRVMTSKGTTPQYYEDLLKGLHKSSLDTMKKDFLKIGVNIDNYIN